MSGIEPVGRAVSLSKGRHKVDTTRVGHLRSRRGASTQEKTAPLS
jgi:hypothetical protein